MTKEQEREKDKILTKFLYKNWTELLFEHKLINKDLYEKMLKTIEKGE